jgi:ribosomal protein L32
MWRSCLKKRAYRSLEKAQATIERIQKERNVELFVYFCPLCGEYHLTHKSRKEFNKNENTKNNT